MEFVDGHITVASFPPGYAETREERRRIGTSLVDTLVRLHAIDFDAVSLGSFGRPDGYLERQVRRWSSQWEANKTRELPAIEQLIRRLNAAIPASPAPTIVHGDYRLGNMLLDHDVPGQVNAVLDWEMSTLGDPLADLGYTLVYWGEANDDRPATIGAYSAATSLAGFHKRDEIVAEYAAKSGRDVSAIEFYVVFALYKLAVITEGIYRRFIEGKAIGRGLEQYAESSVELANYALELAGRSQLPVLRGS
jgi:aminoglycoside phosphotransferase (APT) family kinase protein